MSANGTETLARVERNEVKKPVLEISGTKYECRDLSNLTWAEQIKANKLMDRLSELQESLQEYFDIDDDEDDEEEDPPEEMQEQWRKVHQRIVRFGYPGVKNEDVRSLPPAEVAQASGRFTTYMNRFGQSLNEDDEGNAPKSNRRSRRASQKRSRSSRTSTE